MNKGAFFYNNLIFFLQQRFFLQRYSSVTIVFSLSQNGSKVKDLFLID